MVLIKKYFEHNHNIKIIGGYLVMRTDKWVFAKFKDQAISFVHRKKLCELSCSSPDLNWLHPSHCQQSSAIQYLQRNFLEKYPNALMINCMGAEKILDHSNIGKWRKYSWENRKCLTVCIDRINHNNRNGGSNDAYNLYVKDLEHGLVDQNAFTFINVKVESARYVGGEVRNILEKYQTETKENNENDDDQSIFNKYKQELKEYMNEKCVDYLLSNIYHGNNKAFLTLNALISTFSNDANDCSFEIKKQR